MRKWEDNIWAESKLVQYKFLDIISLLTYKETNIISGKQSFNNICKTE